jgi:flavin reductase (DIM6/NTAB) family NADH-FMN oxidoreductase RutF
MQLDPLLPIGEKLRQAMRCWVTGVTVVTSRFEDTAHGMTANSFGSISLEPPLVTITMNNDTRTFALVRRSGIFAVTILSFSQQNLAELFAGRVPDAGNRMAGLDTFPMVTGAPLMSGGLAFVDCQVVHEYPMDRSTLLIGKVVAAQVVPASEPILPLIYYNRTFHKLEE